ncbi:MAG: SUMF1/EgtB/PvdO family nonheme iron enzyme [Gammaproteobacteria bacterium]|nr:SUMF1/EgtB/PvdO family nonheme iron enzyme [Gammaproteobacteria bacterium]
MSSNLFHTLANIRSRFHAMGSVRETPEKIERTFALFECLWAWLLYNALIENLQGAAQYTHPDFKSLNRPSMGNYLGMLRACIHGGKELPYAGALRNILHAKKHKPASSLPLAPVVKQIYHALGKPATGSNLNLMMLFELIVALRNADVHGKSVAKERLAQIIEVMDENAFLNAMLAEFEPLEAFQLGFVHVFQESGTQNVTLLQGPEPIGACRKQIAVEPSLTPNKLYLFCLQEDGARIIGRAEPFFKIDKSQSAHDTWQCYFYHAAEENKKEYRLNYVTHLNDERLEDTGEKAANPLQNAIRRLTGKSPAEAVAKEKKEPRRKFLRPAGGKPETGWLRVKFLPPLAGVKVKIHENDAEGEALADAVSMQNGITEEMELPKGQAVAVATHRHTNAGNATHIEITSAPIDVYKDDNRTVVMGLPYSLGYSEFHQQALQNLYNLNNFFARHWKLGAFLSLSSAILLFLGLIIYQHYFVEAPRGMVYIHKTTYRTGIVNFSGFHSRASDLLQILSKFAHQPGINAAVAANQFFSNKPHTETLEAFSIDRTEVTVADYLAYLNEKENSLSPEEFDKLKPGDWKKQMERSQVHKTFKKYPVHSVTWHQANDFCSYYGGQLPSSDEWEVAARNLQFNVPDSGSLYPWGYDKEKDYFIAGVTQTSERRENHAAEVCSLDDKNQAGICDLGGNLSEWTRTPDKQTDLYLIRGERYNDRGEIGSLGHIVIAKRETEYTGVIQGFRCIYYEKTRRTDIVPYPGGVYHFGYPKDPRLELLSRHPGDAEYILEESKEHEGVGDFYIMTRKVTHGEYNDFYRNTNKGKGPWSEIIGEPRRFKHTPPPQSGRPDEPVLGISWYSAHAYCAYHNMRLPTAEEWERVVRGDKGWIFPWGMEEDAEKSNRFTRGSDNPLHHLILSMWADGQEWTRSKGWEDEDARLLKGPPEQTVKSVTAYLTTIRQPAPADEDVSGTGFRCIKDRKPSLSERLIGPTSKRLQGEKSEWDPTQL